MQNLRHFGKTLAHKQLAVHQSPLVRNKEGVVVVSGKGRGFCSIQATVSGFNPETDPAGSCTLDPENQWHWPVQVSPTFQTTFQMLKFSEEQRLYLVTKFISSWVFTPLFKNIMSSPLAKNLFRFQTPVQLHPQRHGKGLLIVLFHKYCAMKRIYWLQHIHLFIRGAGDLLCVGLVRAQAMRKGRPELKIQIHLLPMCNAG